MYCMAPAFHLCSIFLISLQGLIVKCKSSTKPLPPLSQSVNSHQSTQVYVPPVSLKTKEFTVPAVKGTVRLPNLQILTQAKETESGWLNTVMEALQKQSLDRKEWISWSAYHASIQGEVIPPAAINALLPLFLDTAHSVAMIKHSMTIVQAAVQHLNPGQVPVLAADQPLFAIANPMEFSNYPGRRPPCGDVRWTTH